MTESQIRAVIDAFAAAAVRARRAGYDGVEVHAAHGYLLSSFLARHTNRRHDRWGGGSQNRFRIVSEVLRAVRDSAGPGYPVFIKLNSDEQARNGTKPDDCVRFAQMVEKTGCCDAVELSCGTMEEGFYMARGAFPTDAIFRYLRPYCHYSPGWRFLTRAVVVPFMKVRQPGFSEGYNLPTAGRVKQTISLPVITVGGMRSRRFMEQAIASGQTDFVSMARPFIAEPDLVHRLESGGNATARCNNCNECVAASDTQPIRCYRFGASGTAGEPPVCNLLPTRG
jgi:2,4-dienoyl-CoA reductase-like NADH-dependent reductase (Old Yellow Enzyme family)